MSQCPKEENMPEDNVHLHCGRHSLTLLPAALSKPNKTLERLHLTDLHMTSALF